MRYRVIASLTQSATNPDNLMNTCIRFRAKDLYHMFSKGSAVPVRSHGKRTSLTCSKRVPLHPPHNSLSAALQYGSRAGPPCVISISTLSISSILYSTGFSEAVFASTDCCLSCCVSPSTPHCLPWHSHLLLGLNSQFASFSF